MSEYKRLTRKDEKGRWVADANHFGLYIDTTGKTRYGDVEVVYGDVVNRLAELEDMAEKIREHSLPVGIRDIVYYVYHDGGYTELKIIQIGFGENGVAFIGKSDSGGQIEFTLFHFGSCVFLTEEEAQRKSEEWSR